ncbi:sodium/potassium/calcium exchanger 4 precursor, putative [Pediculus humanus corporis]|uniref:Sodium/potassium/calcium exchanger 4, putative n=1 Tax=Pediculus humanus subsp. corporis TaxID=121224 RepID=E0VXT8_PEDHC|nr:sodium/potassium/calcium exchanger 4 precursor, putative [Pediculus humanus corporis]EEB18194.1 sodium/potassium/calcium exchanger 4 precursor, putative [Pediculus humanus corporis]
MSSLNFERHVCEGVTWDDPHFLSENFIQYLTSSDTNNNNNNSSSSDNNNTEIFLLATSSIPIVKNDEISEFPPDLFSVEILQRGGIILHLAGALYSFANIGIICGDYFLPAVDCICSDLNLSQDLAAATFMSFATTAPELFVILIATFLTQSDIGLGAVIGGGMFNILGVATVGGLAAKTSIKLDWWPLFRDSTVYVISVGGLAFVLFDGYVTLYESLFLITYYFIYLFIMFWNRKIRKKIKQFGKIIRRKKFKTNKIKNSTALPNVVMDDIKLGWEKNKKILPISGQSEEDEKNDDDDDDDDPETAFKAYFMHYEECISLRRLSLTSRTSLNERRKSVRSLRKHSSGHQKRSSRLSIQENPNFDSPKEIEEEEEVEEKRKDELTLTDDEEPEEQTFKMIFCTLPVNSIWSKFSWFSLWPACFVFYWTIPDTRTKKFKKFYPVTFIMCIFWIGILSYFATWMISRIGFVLGISESIMGLTFLAIGGSMPEAISTYIMARQGEGGLGFSNSLGGNTMDICLCLGLPWFLKCLTNDSVAIYSEGMQYNALAIILGIVVLVSVGICTKFHMNKKMGFTCLSFYLLYIILSVLIELEIIPLKIKS